jgi:hypothetical protein
MSSNPSTSSAKAERLSRERHTIRVMSEIYCKGRHGTARELCAECRELFDYAMQRIDKCPFQDDKPTCAKCPIHCYKPAMRERVRRMMRYSGPRMLIYHPALALLHYRDEWVRARQDRAATKRRR